MCVIQCGGRLNYRIESEKKGCVCGGEGRVGGGGNGAEGITALTLFGNFFHHSTFHLRSWSHPPYMTVIAKSTRRS